MKSLSVFFPLLLTIILLAHPALALLQSSTTPLIQYSIDVKASIVGGPLARYGINHVYARLLVKAAPSGEIIGNTYIVDFYPSILLSSPLRGYVEQTILSTAIGVVQEVMRKPPPSPPWKPSSQNREIAIVYSSGSSQTVYKCEAVKWLVEPYSSGDTIVSKLAAYLPRDASIPLVIEASLETPGYTVDVNAWAQYLQGAEPCGSPALSGTAREALGLGVAAIILGAIISYVKRPRAIVVVLRPEYPYY